MTKKSMTIPGILLIIEVAVYFTLKQDLATSDFIFYAMIAWGLVFTITLLSNRELSVSRLTRGTGRNGYGVNNLLEMERRAVEKEYEQRGQKFDGFRKSSIIYGPYIFILVAHYILLIVISQN